MSKQLGVWSITSKIALGFIMTWDYTLLIQIKTDK
jgi:hypothetical protein